MLVVLGCLCAVMLAANAQMNLGPFKVGTGCVESVTPLDGGCVFQERPPSGTEYWNVQQAHSYRVRLVNVTECSDDIIYVHVFNPYRRTDDPEDHYKPQCLQATRVAPGVYEFIVSFDLDCKSYFIRYCTNRDCTVGGFIARRSDCENAPAVLRLGFFRPADPVRACKDPGRAEDCIFLGEDKDCRKISCCAAFRFKDLELGCNPETIPDCSELYAHIQCDESEGLEGCCDFVILHCQNGEDEPDPDRGPCWFRRKVSYCILTLREFEVCEVEGYIRWQEDEEPPTITPPPDRDLGCNPDPNDIPDCDDILRETKVTDNCEHEPVTVDCTSRDVRQGCIVTRVFVINAIDKCGNRSKAEVRVTWNEDTERPRVKPPADRDLGCNPAEIPDCEDILRETQITDNCAHEPPIVECDYRDDRDGCIVTRTFTITATDKCGYSTTATVRVTWNEDTTPPTITPPPDRDLGCNPRTIPTCDDILRETKVTDNCEHEPVTVDCTSRDVRQGCIVTRVFVINAIDKCGNRSKAEVRVTWNEDTERPRIKPPRERDLGCNPRTIPTCEDILRETTVTDNCAHEPPVVECRFEDERDGCLWTRTFTIVARDKCGNSAKATVRVFWNEDREPPVIDPPDDRDLGCNPRTIPTCDDILRETKVTDNCTHEPPTLICGFRDVRRGCIVTRVFVINAIDKCGNRSKAEVRVTWNVDTTPPDVKPPRDRDLGCNPARIPTCEDILRETRIADNCIHEPLTVNCEYEDSHDGCLWTRTFTITATDKCGNSTTARTRVFWNEDREPPVIDPPDDRDLGCNPRTIPTCDDILRETKVTDNCTHEPPTLICGFRDIRQGCIVTRVFVINAIDKCGNRSKAEVRVTWNEDTERPRIRPPRERDLGCNPAHIPTCDDILRETKITDNCAHEPPVVECRFEDERDGCLWTRTFTIVARDKCGNSAKATVRVFWNEDREPPVIDPPDDRDLGCNPRTIPTCDDILRETKVTDNCEHGSITLDCTSRDVRQGCIVTRVFVITAIDKCGNRSKAEVRVTWNEDTTPPDVKPPHDRDLGCNPAEIPDCDDILRESRISDNCTHEPLTVDCKYEDSRDGCLWTRTFTITATDKCGNSTTARTRVFWNEDREPPVIDPPDDRDLGCNPQNIPTCEDILRETKVTDNCTHEPVTVNCTFRDVEGHCTVTRVFFILAIDKCGNRSQAEVRVSWTVDNRPPQIRCPNDIVVQMPPGECLIKVDLPPPDVRDKCDPNPRVECSPDRHSFFPIGTKEVTCTATDRCGNSASCRFRVTVLGYICGVKFEDRNGNGRQDPDEPGLGGWTIQLLQNGTVVATTVTGPDGRFCFLGLPEGTYRVREVLQPGWTPTTPIEREVVLPRDCGKLVFFGNRRLR